MRSTAGGPHANVKSASTHWFDGIVFAEPGGHPGPSHQTISEVSSGRSAWYSRTPTW